MNASIASLLEAIEVELLAPVPSLVSVGVWEREKEGEKESEKEEAETKAPVLEGERGSSSSSSSSSDLFFFLIRTKQTTKNRPTSSR